MIHSTCTDGLAEIVLDAPQRLNAVDAEALHELVESVGRAEADGARALLLRGEGKGFCAGRDIAGVDPREDDVIGFLGGPVTDAMRALADLPIPTFAAVHGACLGVGLGLALACDVVYTAEDAKLGSPFKNLGATLDSGGHWLLAERLGTHRAMDLIITGDLITGADAVQAGLFSRAVPSADLLDFTRERAQAAASGPTGAFLASKRLLARIRDERLGFWDVLELENRAQADLCDTDDYREGFAAFQQKRQPRFTGGR